MDRQCQCLTKQGQGPRCSRNAIPGQLYCYQHQNCEHPHKGKKIVQESTMVMVPSKPKPAPAPAHAPASAPKPKESEHSTQKQPSPPITFVPPTTHKIQQREETIARVRQKNQECQICGQYVNVRKTLRPLKDYPLYLQDRQRIVNLCTNCYQECMRQCVSVMGKDKELECRKHICDDYYLAKELAKSDQERLREEGRHRAAGVAATQIKLGMGTQMLPNVPKTQPK